MPPKSFKFRLQTILEHKQDMEDKEKEKLAKVIAKLEQAKQQLAMLEETRVKTRAEMKEKQRKGGVNIDELKIYNAFLKKLDKDIIQMHMVIEQIKLEEKMQRNALLKAAQERQAFEKIKEKQKEVFNLELEEYDRKLIDELATIKFARKAMEENAELEARESGEWEEEE